MVHLNAAVVPRIGLASRQRLLKARTEGQGLLEAACEASLGAQDADGHADAGASGAGVAAQAEDAANGPHSSPRGKMEARHFLAVELQGGAVRQAGHVWVHVPDSLAREHSAEPAKPASVVRIEPLLRTLSSERARLTRQVFRANNGKWAEAVTSLVQAQAVCA